MTLRILTLVAIVGFAYLAVAISERRTRRAIVGLPPGLTVITGPTCQLCVAVITALNERGTSPNVLDVSQAPASLGTIRGLPHAVIVDRRGEITMRRTGRSALTDADHIAVRARQPA